nr:MAG TPA: hypothetical protein [Caudoviricetes sp.]
MEKADRKTMLVHFDTWLTLTATMSDAQVGQLLRAAIAYARGESESEACFGGDRVLALAFSMLKMSDDMDWKQYRLKCEKLKANIQKRWRKQIQTNTNEYNSIQMGTYTNTNTNTNTNTDVVTTNSNELAITTTNQKDNAQGRELLLSRLRDKMYREQIKLHNIAASLHATVEDVLRTGDAVIDEWELTDEPAKGINMKHLLSQIRIKWEAQQRLERQRTADDRERDWINDMAAGAIDNLERINNGKTTKK